MRISNSFVVASALWLGACSTVMEANRPNGVQLSTYHLGEQRVDVVSTMGAPQTAVQDGDRSCDVYSVYTSRTNGAQKAAVILGEGAADLFTVGLFEIVATPAQAAAKPSRHTVLMCYGGDNGLVAVKDNGETVVGSPVANDPRPPNRDSRLSASTAPPATQMSAPSEPSPPPSRSCGAVQQDAATVELKRC